MKELNRHQISKKGTSELQTDKKQMCTSALRYFLSVSNQIYFSWIFWLGKIMCWINYLKRRLFENIFWKLSRIFFLKSWFQFILIKIWNWALRVAFYFAKSFLTRNIAPPPPAIYTQMHPLSKCGTESCPQQQKRSGADTVIRFDKKVR